MKAIFWNITALWYGLFSLKKMIFNYGYPLQSCIFKKRVIFHEKLPARLKISKSEIANKNLEQIKKT